MTQLLYRLFIIGIFFTISQNSYAQDFDLALTIKETSSGPYVVGDIVSFDITTYNQGSLDATQVRVNFFYPTGTSVTNYGSFSPTIPFVSAGTTIATLLSGNSHTESISIQIDDDSFGSYLYINAEIRSAQNSLNLPDADDLINSYQATQNTTAELSTNDDIDDEAPGTPGTMDNPNDQDDFDIELIEIRPNWDMTVDLSGVFNDENNDGLAQAGETVLFTCTVTNTGNQPLTSIEVVDNIGFNNSAPIQIFNSKGPILNLQAGQVDNSTYSCPYTLTIHDIINGSVTHFVSTTADYIDPNQLFPQSFHDGTNTTVNYISQPAALSDPMIETESGDVYIHEAENGVILKSPSGNCFRVRVEDDGTLRSVPITCP